MTDKPDYEAARRGAAPVVYLLIVLAPLALCVLCGVIARIRGLYRCSQWRRRSRWRLAT